MPSGYRPSSYYRHREHQLHPDSSHRDQSDEHLKQEIQRVYDENYGVYGVRKVWRQLLREGFSVARCTIARLMKSMGLTGVLRGKKLRTTISRKNLAAHDRESRQFVAERPDQLWVTDFTYASTRQDFAYVAFIIDVFAGHIVGWRVSSSVLLDGDDVRAGCSEAGVVGSSAIRNPPSQRQRFTVCVAGLHTAVAGGRASCFNRKHGGLL